MHTSIRRWIAALSVLIAVYVLLMLPNAPAGSGRADASTQTSTNPPLADNPTPGQSQPPAVKEAGESTPAPKAGDDPALSAATPATTNAVASPSGFLQPRGKDPKSYRYLVFAPALIAILCAIFTRQVVPSLILGVLIGAYMMIPCMTPGDRFTENHPVIGGFRLAAEKYVLESVVDPDGGYSRAKIIMFTLTIGFMVGAIGRNGGTAGMVRLLAGGTSSPRRGELTAWSSGLIVFFDDYANAMIIGPTMAPIFDRLKLSRAKLAYIVDSTSAPVASLAIIGTWIGAEIGYIGDGFKALHESGTPEFLATVTPMGAFLNSLQYRFYPILTLVLVLFLALTGRDFGPMRKSQQRAAQGDNPLTRGAPAQGALGHLSALHADRHTEPVPRWWLGFFPVLVLVVVTLVILGVSGYRTVKPDDWAANPTWWQKSGLILGSGDSYLSIFYGAILAAFTSIILTAVARACPTRATVEAGLEGMGRMFPAIVILILAWAISGASQDLQLGTVAKDYLEHHKFAPQWFPFAVFVASALISFATGTSWATMGLLCPMVVQVGAGLAADMPAETALPLFYSAVGSVLAGSIFGDHCSPISDTTVLSSMASGCPHDEHVVTQLPYAILAALVSIVVGNILRDVYGQPWWLGMILGAVILLVVVLAFGRSAQPYGRSASC